MSRMKRPCIGASIATFVGTVVLSATSSLAQPVSCPVTHAELTDALVASVATQDVFGNPNGGTLDGTNGGLDFNMWASVVNRDGIVCAVTFTGSDNDDQWPASRVISAQKANTANSLSLDRLALSTANLWAATQPGGSLFGLQFSNPVDFDKAYAGDNADYGTEDDPMIGEKVGGVNVFGGGLALYDGPNIVGAVGVSGDSSCADHNVAWRTRQILGLDSVPAGVQPNNGDDGIIYDIISIGQPGHLETVSASGFGHPTCGGTEDDVAAAIGSGSTP